MSILGCANNVSQSNKNVWVYDSRQRMQCQKNYSLENSKQLLTSIGVAVSNSACGYPTTFATCQACFICGTGEVIVHEIHVSDLSSAIDEGFYTLDSKENYDSIEQYMLTPCKGFD
ncbi:hypothetical protein SAMN05421686_101533 [Thalassolituus maritimus]|uniref:Uncharacterized protein n=1 Tax=Thalassolituus maritimus TaxID=484498 RepID=A0A1N7JA01_9GAMM|nr:hypothetical protein SAMN05421686_101533 [Thalassolituus maritimus]